MNSSCPSKTLGNDDDDDDDDDGSYFFPNLAHKYVFEHGWFELGILKYVIPKNKKSSLAKAVQQKDVNQNSAILKLRSLNPLERSAPCSRSSRLLCVSKHLLNIFEFEQW